MIEIAGAGFEINFRPQSLDQQIDLVGMLLDERIRIGFDMLDLAYRGYARKDLHHELARLFTVKVGALAAPERIEPVIELTLEPIDNLRIEAYEVFLVDELIKPVLSFDQEVQSPFSVLDVKGQKIVHPRWKGFPGLGFEFQPSTVCALVDDFLAHGPGIDDFRDHPR